MFPNFTKFTQEHPRAAVVFGVALFVAVGAPYLTFILYSNFHLKGGYATQSEENGVAQMEEKSVDVVVEETLTRMEVQNTETITDEQIEAELKALGDTGTYAEITEENLALQLEAMEQAKNSN